MGYLGVTVDGRTFRVRIVKDTYREHIDFIEGPLAGDMDDGYHERDLRGAAATFTMTVQPDFANLQDYDDLWDLLRQPINEHRVSVIEDQGTLSYFAQIQTIDRTVGGMVGGRRLFKDMTLAFVPSEPQWRPTT